MYWVDVKYAMQLRGRLDKFVVKNQSPLLINFRCYLCGDSEKNKTKARGYMYAQKDTVHYHCHNCGITKSISKVLKELDPLMYKEYLMETFQNGNQRKEDAPSISNPKPVFKRPPASLAKLKKVSQLDPAHPAKLYVVGRGIPTKYHHKLYFCSKFVAWTNSMIPNKLSPEHDHSRLIIPMFDKEGEMYGYQGRSLSPTSKMRYITIILDEDVPKIYGMDTCDVSRTHYITEGPIDSMFLENSMAMVGSDAPLGWFNKDTAVFVYDNEPRNKEIVTKISKTVSRGYKVVIWPSSIDKKDINDMVMINLDVNSIVKENTFSGLEAMATLEKWKK